MGRWIAEIGRVLRFAFGFRRKQDELDTEMNFHLEEAIDDLVDQGMSREDARKTALREFGGVERIKEECRDSWGTRVVADVGRDCRLSIRLLRKKKGFAAAVFLTLGLCIAGNAIVFSILDTVLGPPLYPEPDRVVEIYNSYPGLGFDRSGSNVALYLDILEHTTAFEQLALLHYVTANISSEASSIRGEGLQVTDAFFEMIRVRPLVGRFFSEEDFVHSNSKHLILAESFWRTQFAAKPDVIGKTLKLDGQPFIIIGVAPQSACIHSEDLRYFQARTWDPKATEELKGQRHMNRSRLWGRLKPGFTADQAKAQIDACDQRYFDEVDQETKDRLTGERHETRLETFQDRKIDTLGGTLNLLQGSVLLVLLIGCMNIVNLQLARSAGRSTEYAMRKSLGATHMTLARQLIIENALLCFGSCLLGLLVGWGGLVVINQYILQDLLPEYSRIELSANSIVLTLYLTLGIALVLGLFSVLPARKNNLSALMQEGSQRTTSNKSMKLFRAALVSLQVAMSLILLIGTGLLLQSFVNALKSDSGFDSSDVMTASWELPWNYDSRERQSQFCDRLKQSLREIPGIGSFAISEHLPSVEGYPNWGVFLASPGEAGLPTSNTANITVVSDGFFEMLGIPLLSGRYFLPTDMVDGVRNVVVDRKFADTYFKGRNPIGQKITRDHKLNEESLFEIVGVVESIKHNGLDREDVISSDHGRYPLVYFPMNWTMDRKYLSVLIKSERSLDELISIFRKTIREIDPIITIDREGELESMMVESLNDRRAFLLLIGILGVMALLLSSIGVYGVLAYDVSQRTREIGFRMAIGSPQSLVLKQVLNQGMVNASFGVAIGLIGAWLLSEYLSEFLYQVSPIEPFAYFLVAAFILLNAFAASYFPARQATCIQPAVALRSE